MTTKFRHNASYLLMNLQPGLYQILVNENGVVEKFSLIITK
jgi:hypothetical protein